MGSVGDHLLLIVDIFFLYIWLEMAMGLLRGYSMKIMECKKRGVMWTTWEICVEGLSLVWVFKVQVWPVSLFSHGSTFTSVRIFCER